MRLFIAAAGEYKGCSFLHLEVAGKEKLQSKQVLEPENKQVSQVIITQIKAALYGHNKCVNI